MKHRRIEQILGIGIVLIGLTLIVKDCTERKPKEESRINYELLRLEYNYFVKKTSYE